MIDQDGKRIIVRSWKDISSYLKQSVKTCRRWEVELGLPIHRLEDTPKARVFAYEDELDQWMEEIQKSGNTIIIKEKKHVKRLILAVSAIAVITIIIWFNYKKQETSFSTTGTPAIAVMYFENHTGDENLDYLMKALPVSLIHPLMQLKSVRVLSFDELKTTLKNLGIAHLSAFSSKDLNRIMKKAGVDYIIYGYFIRAGKILRLDITIRNSYSKKFFESKTTQCHEDEIILKTVDELIPWILSCLESEEEASTP